MPQRCLLLLRRIRSFYTLRRGVRKSQANYAILQSRVIVQSQSSKRRTGDNGCHIWNITERRRAVRSRTDHYRSTWNVREPHRVFCNYPERKYHMQDLLTCDCNLKAQHLLLSDQRLSNLSPSISDILLLSKSK